MEKIKEIEEQMDEEEISCFLPNSLQEFLEYQGVQSFLQWQKATDLIINTTKNGNYFMISIEIKYPQYKSRIDSDLYVTEDTISNINLEIEKQIISYMIKYTQRYGQKISDYLISTAVDDSNNIATLTVHR